MRTKPYPSEIQDRFIIRMPDGMRDTLKRLSKQNRRSMNAEIVARLSEALERNYQVEAEMAFGVEEERHQGFDENLLLTFFRRLSPDKKKALLELLK